VKCESAEEIHFEFIGFKRLPKRVENDNYWSYNGKLGKFPYTARIRVDPSKHLDPQKEAIVQCVTIGSNRVIRYWIFPINALQGRNSKKTLFADQKKS